VPTDDPAQYVWILMKSEGLQNADPADTATLTHYGILYAPGIGEELIDESVGDSTLTTYLYLPSGIAYRRIKHFSGYNVTFGLAGFSLTARVALDY
jgi:hypothetical protein